MDNSPILFYEPESYPFSNFSSFQVDWKGILFQTSEHAYHWEKFLDEHLKDLIRDALSAHACFRLALKNAGKVREDWLEIRVSRMEAIVWKKLCQHEYIQKKLHQTGSRDIIESSPVDPFWGWGPNKDGENQLGKIWMRARDVMDQNNWKIEPTMTLPHQ